MLLAVKEIRTFKGKTYILIGFENFFSCQLSKVKIGMKMLTVNKS